MADSCSRIFACPICGSEFRHSNSLTRHALSAHQLVRLGNQFVTGTEEEFARRRASLRRQQMSSRRRRRQSVVPELSGACSSQVAAIRSSQPEPQPTLFEDWDTWIEMSNLPDLAPEQPQMEKCDAESLTNPVLVVEPPPVFADGTCQTDDVNVVSTGVNTVDLRPMWPRSLDFNYVIRFVRDRPHRTLDQMTAELFTLHQGLSVDECNMVRAAISGIAWGFHDLARYTLGRVREVMDVPARGPTLIARLQAELYEQADRRF